MRLFCVLYYAFLRQLFPTTNFLNAWIHCEFKKKDFQVLETSDRQARYIFGILRM